MQAYVPQHLERFLYVLGLVSKEVTHLQETQRRLFKAGQISADWVKNLTVDDPAQDTLEAFASRFGRLQDSLADKLLPRLALLEGEKPGSAIDNLNRAERLGLISSTKGWLAMRALRNKLVHEYVDDPNEFANALNQAASFVPKLVDTYRRIQTRAEQRLGSVQIKRDCSIFDLHKPPHPHRRFSFWLRPSDIRSSAASAAEFQQILLNPNEATSAPKH